MRNARKSNRNGQLLFALILVVALVAQPSGSFAQNQEEEQVIADGSYLGVMGIEGIFFYGVAIPQSTSEVLLSWDGKAEGDFELSVALGEVDGTWRMFGDAVVEGDFSTDAGTMLLAGPQQTSASGTINGIASRPATQVLLGKENSFRFEGLSTVTTQLSLAGELAELIGSSLPPTIDNQETTFVVTRLTSIKCGSFVGDWTQQIEEKIEEANLSPALNGTFSAVRTHDANPQDLMDQIKSLVKRGLTLINNMRAGSVSIKALTAWANQANGVMFSIKRDLECGFIEDDAKYLTPIANIVYQMIVLLNDQPGFKENRTLNTVFMVAVGQAMLGPGWPGKGDISKISETIDNNLQVHIENDIADGKMDSDEAKIYMDSAQATGSEGAQEAVSNWQSSQAGD